MGAYLVKHNLLTEYCKDIFIGFGETPANALIIAESLVDADLRGISSHGVMRVGNYVNRIKGGGARVNPTYKIISETGTTALIDADNGLGAPISEFAVKLAREKAKKNGMAFITVKNSNHNGAAGRWSIRLAGDDMFGMAATSVEPLIAVTGGKSRGIGNNPISYSFPTLSFGNICYDVSCGMLAFGKVYDSRVKNRPLPTNCFLDRDGVMTTDPFSAFICLPFGGHKGYGLAVVVEMLTSILSGESFCSNIGLQYEKPDEPNRLSHSFMAANIEAFRDILDFKKYADSFIEYLHDLPKAEEVENIYFPGEVENINLTNKLISGVIVQDTIVDELRKLAAEVNIDAERGRFLTEKIADSK